MDSQTIASLPPSSSDDNNYVARPVIREPVSLGASDGESEDGGFISAGEDVPDRAVGLGLGGLDRVGAGFRPVAKISCDDDYEEEEDEEDEEGGGFGDEEFVDEVEEGGFGGSRVKVAAAEDYEREEEEELVEGEGVNGDVVGGGEERRVFVGKKLGESGEEDDGDGFGEVKDEGAVGEVGGEEIVVGKQVELASGETDKVEFVDVGETVVDKNSGVKGIELSVDEVVRMESGISLSANGGVNGPVAANLEKKVLNELFAAGEMSEGSSVVNGDSARDTESVGVESKVGLLREAVKAEVESKAAAASDSQVLPQADSVAQPEGPAVVFGSVEHKSYRDVLIGEEKEASLADRKSVV